jgi:hypothetical protein
MENSVRLNVLWVDDMPTEEFMNEAYDYGLDITSVKSVNGGIATLKDKTKVWDAIILDANCKITDNVQEQPSLMALKKAVEELVHIRADVPWFVYTGGDYEGVEHLIYMIKERDYDDRPFYEKPQQRYNLYDNIKKAVSHNELFKLRKKYPREFEAAEIIDGATQLLQEGLTYNYNEEWRDVQDYFNPARKICERIFDKLKDQKKLPPISKLNTMSKLLSKGKIDDDNCYYELKKEVMPAPLAHSLRFFLDITQDGSHDKGDLDLGVDSYIRKSHNINLFNSILFLTMDLLLWYKNFIDKSKDVEELWSGGPKYEYTGKACISPDGRYWYTGMYELMKDKDLVDGISVGVKWSIDNKKSKPGIKKYVPRDGYVIIKE